MCDFNFDEWADLHRNHPEEFERKRKEFLDAEILKAPVSSRNKLRLLQMECDAIRQSYSSLRAVDEISKLMIEKMCDLQDAVLDLNIACAEFDKIQKLI